MTAHTPPPDPPAVQAMVRESGYEISEVQAEQLAVYLRLLEQWNTRINLVGPRKWPQMLSQLVADSWHLAALLQELQWPHQCQSLDLGAGAGLPGIPLRLFWTHGRYTLVEIRQKRVAFLHNALAQMELPGTSIHHGRAEELPETLLPAHLVLSRAFMPWHQLLPLAGSLLDKTGRLIILSNTPARQEMFAERARLVQVRPYQIGDQTRYFWVLDRLARV